MKVGFIAATRLHSSNENIPARDFFAVSPLFRYSLAYCKKYYDDVFILHRGSRTLILPDDKVENYDYQGESPSRADKKKWVRSISNEIKDTLIPGTKLYFHVSNWNNLLIKWLKPEFEVIKPMKGKAIGEQLKFYKSQVGQLPSIKN